MIKRFIAVILAIAIVVTQTNQVLAIDRSTFFQKNDILSYDPDACAYGIDEACTCTTGGATPGGASSTISKNIPAEWQPLFTSAAAKFNTNANFVATLYMSENGNVWHPLNRTDWAVSSAGATGPMQFLRGTWAGYGQDGDGDGVKNINDIEDSVFAAAAFASALGADADTPVGSLDTPRKADTLLAAAAGYNWGPGNVDNNRDGGLDSLPEETKNYVNNVYTLLDSDFILSGHPNYGAPRLSTSTATVDTDVTAAPVEQVCGGGGVGVSDGFTFPLITTRSAIEAGTPWGGGAATWCYRSETSCHHDYNAADIHLDAGATVIAAVGGTVIAAKDYQTNPSQVGTRAVIKGTDGNIYYYAHMGPGTLKISDGETIKPAQEIGKLGESQYAVGTAPHLHIDALPPTYRDRMSCSSAACSQYPFIDIQPSLIKAFNTLQ